MMTEDRHEWATERLSDYIDGNLPPAEAERVARHLDTCPSCSALRGDLESLVAASRGLGAIEPPTDLWPGIAVGIEGARREQGSGSHPSVTTLRTTKRGSGRGRGGAEARWPWPLRSLLAAAAVLVVVSASLAWWGRGMVVSPVVSPLAGPTVPGNVRPVAASAQASLPESLAQELQELEGVVVVMRDRLDPGTVDVLERNLLLIERAIEDSYQALALDPENEFVREHLERTYERKRDILREVSRLAELAG